MHVHCVIVPFAVFAWTHVYGYSLIAIFNATKIKLFFDCYMYSVLQASKRIRELQNEVSILK